MPAQGLRSQGAASLLCGVFALAASAVLPVSAVAQVPKSQQALEPPPPTQAPVQDDVRKQLVQYGTFVKHPKYGEVWVPGVTPPGWHPYPPCQWVNTQRYGWYYDDHTPWGQIVHHYGRWVFTQDMGWIWTPSTEWSPGWVVWRTNPQYVGWAPMLPDQDIQTVSADAFNASDQWLFMNASQFATGCSASLLVAGPQVPPLIQQTTYVTRLEYVDGIAVFVLPAAIIGPFVEIDALFAPYPIDFFTQLIVDWNFVFHHFKPKVQVVTACTYSAPH